MPYLLQNLLKFFPPLLLSLPHNLRSLNPFSGDVNPVTNDPNFTMTHETTLGNIRYVKSHFSANTVFKTTLSAARGRDSIRSPSFLQKTNLPFHGTGEQFLQSF